MSMPQIAPLDLQPVASHFTFLTLPKHKIFS